MVLVVGTLNKKNTHHPPNQPTHPMPRSRKSRSSVPRYPTAETTAGQRRQVYEGRAQMTAGGLKKKDLKRSKTGKIVSRRASKAAKRNFQRNGLAAYKYD